MNMRVRKIQKLLQKAEDFGWNRGDTCSSPWYMDAVFERHVDRGYDLSDVLIVKIQIYPEKPLDESYILMYFKKDKTAKPILYTNEIKLFNDMMKQMWEMFRPTRREKKK